MNSIRVTCIKLMSSEKKHEYITHIGSPTQKWSTEQAILLIDSNTTTFYVLDENGKRADIVVVRPAGQKPHLRTSADGILNNNLLSLPNCY